MLSDDYFKLQEDYQKKYGKVVVLQAVGQFFEILQVDNDEEKIGEVTMVAEILNIVKTKKDKKNPKNDRSNPYLCGFPLASLHRCLGVLISAGYTCVISEQTQTQPKIRREVTRVVSPGTYDLDMQQYQANHLVYLTFKKENRSHGDSFHRLGCATFDVSTGESTVYETFDTESDKSFALAEAIRMIKSFNPREVILNGDLSETIQNQLELGDRVVHVQPRNPGTERVQFMNQFLAMHYEACNHMSPIEALDLENKMLACMAFVQLMRFVFEHNENALVQLQRPKILNEIGTLCLENNAIQQLNVLPTTPHNVSKRATPNAVGCLLDVVGYCKTPMGHRRLRDRLCRPMCVPGEIIDRHNRIDELLSEDLWEIVGDKLRNVGDIERLARKLTTQGLGRGMTTMDMVKIWSGVDAACECIRMMLQKSRDKTTWRGILGEHEGPSNDGLIEKLSKTFDRSSLETDNYEYPIFRKGYDSKYDAALRGSSISKSILQIYRKAFNDVLDSANDGMVKLEFTDKEGWFLTTTKKRADDIRKRMPLTIEMESQQGDDGTMLIERETVTSDTLQITQSTSTAKISTPKFRQSASIHSSDVDLVKALTNQLFDEFCRKFGEEHAVQLKRLSESMVQIDLCICAAETAVKRRWCKPEVDTTSGESYITVEDLRHPIIEAVHKDIEYVPCSLDLGKPGTSDIAGYAGAEGSHDGILLYGCNSAGKSSVMKALGLSVILAQAGFFVPARKFKIRPFTSIMTRILGNDDIFKGHSSFAVEMSELNSILRRADAKTLVLGDEIANSTESTSGLAIVATAIARLSEARTKFVFATHLHELAKMKLVTALNNVVHFHLEIRYDPVMDELRYDRTLKPGSGTAIYGLEIARAMGMDDEFLSTAHNIRRELLGMENRVVTDRVSHFNTKLCMRPCQICGGVGVDVHHIKEQKHADERGFIDCIHKNQLSNLVVLCKNCHDKIHVSETLEIRGYVQTTNGRKLDVRENICGKKNNGHARRGRDLEGERLLHEKDGTFDGIKFRRCGNWHEEMSKHAATPSLEELII